MVLQNYFLNMLLLQIYFRRMVLVLLDAAEPCWPTESPIFLVYMVHLTRLIQLAVLA